MAQTASVLVLGLSYRTATLEARERAALDDAPARALLRRLAADPRVDEALVLSTCNRTEIYAAAGDAAAAETALRHHFPVVSGIGAATLACSSYALHEDDALGHLFRVTAGLDSAVLGESEIVGQQRRAAERAAQEGMLGPLLGEASRRALLAARQVRRRTGIARGPTALASSIARAAREHRREGTILLVGAGRLGGSVLGALAGIGAGPVVVANRTPATARELASRHGATGVALRDVAAELDRADVVVAATHAPGPVVTAEQVRSGRTRSAPLTVFDLGVPRDVEPEVATLAGVVVHDIDAVHARLESARRLRSEQVGAASEIVRAEVARYLDWRRELDAAPMLDALWRHAEAVRRTELARWTQGATPEERARMEALTASLVRKLLDEPTKRLRSAARASGPRLADDVRDVLAVALAPPPPRPRLARPTAVQELSVLTEDATDHRSPAPAA